VAECTKKLRPRKLLKTQRASMAQADKDAAAWNEKTPEGAPVCVHRDNGEILKTATRSAAWNLCGMAVVLVEGISGGYALDHMHLLEVANG
jgi:hypothetical protein